MMRVVVYSSTGGVSKSNTTLNLAAALARSGNRKVVMVDLDPEMHLTRALGAPSGGHDFTAQDWIAGTEGRPVAAPSVPGLYLIPGVAGGVDLPTARLLPHSTADWLVMDAGPKWSAGLAHALAGSTMLLSPLEADFQGMNAVSQLIGQMQDAGLPRSLLRLLLCRFSNRLVLHREVRSKMSERFGVDLLLPVVIRNTNRLSEVPMIGQTIFDHAPQSTGAADFTSLAEALTQERRLASVRRHKAAAS